MYAVIRTYGEPELAGQLAAHADEVKSLVSAVPGFNAYYLVKTDEGCMTISVYDDRSGADESTRRAAEWLREHSSEVTASTPQVAGGEVLVQA